MTTLYGYITNTPQPEDYGFDHNNGAAIDETWKYVAPLGMGLRRLGLNALKGLRQNTVNNVLGTEELISRFFDKNNPNLENFPPIYDGERNIDSVLNFLGNKGIVNTPNREVIFNEKNLPHYLFENNSERLNDLGKVKRTFENPSLIIKGQRFNKDYNYYAKPFLHNNRVRGHLGIARSKDIGNFYQTNFNLRENKLRDLLNGGQVIYNDLPVSTAPISKDMPVNNIITDNSKNFNPTLFERIMGIFKK